MSGLNLFTQHIFYFGRTCSPAYHLCAPLCIYMYVCVCVYIYIYIYIYHYYYYDDDQLLLLNVKMELYGSVQNFIMHRFFDSAESPPSLTISESLKYQVRFVTNTLILSHLICSRSLHTSAAFQICLCWQTSSSHFTVLGSVSPPASLVSKHYEALL